MKVLDAEKKIGIATFFTLFEGLGGKLRTKPEDFFVREISNYPPEKTDGKFTIADVTATNWETNLLVRELSNRLQISRQRVGFAGTKDKRAKTIRLMSFYKVPIEKLYNVKIKDVEIENIYYSDRPVKIGNLVGNSFEIVIRNINENANIKNIQTLDIPMRHSIMIPSVNTQIASAFLLPIRSEVIPIIILPATLAPLIVLSTAAAVIGDMPLFTPVATICANTI